MNKPRYFSPVVTAFDKDGGIDAGACVGIWDRLIEGGVTGLVVMGSTGEFFSLKPSQKRELIELAAKHIKGRVEFFVGTGNMRMDDTVELSNIAFDNGADGVMVISPYYFNLTDDSIELYFGEVAKAVKGNVFLYNFPERTSYDLKPKIALNLIKKYSNIIGYKDTVGSMSHTRELITTVRDGGFDDFAVLSGKDENFAHTLLSGGNGSIGGLSNLYPEVCGAWVKAFEANDMEKVSCVQKVVDRMHDFGNIGSPFIPILKKAMILRGVEMQDVCQFPFMPATDAQTEKIKDMIDKIDSLVASVV